MENVRVSVIIPTHNYAHFLPDAIKSVLEQTHHNIEIIVVDDGSVDHTRDVVANFGEKIKYIYQNNQGLSAARNTGIAASTGDYIQFLDADDILGKDVIAGRLCCLSRIPDTGIAVCGCRFFTLTCNQRPIWTILNGWPMYRHHIGVHLCYSNIAPPHAFLASRKIIRSIGFFDITLQACEDYDYWLRAAEKGFTFHFCSQGVVYYRRHSKSMSANTSKQVAHDAIMHRRLRQIFEQNSMYMEDNRTESLMAFVAGGIKILAQMRSVQKRLDEDVIHSCIWAITMLECLLKKKQWSFMLHFYWLLAMVNLARLSVADPECSMHLYNRLSNCVVRAIGSHSSVALIWHTLGMVAAQPEGDCFERYRMIKYLTRFLRTHRLSI